jgi:hypothetical protein
MGRTVYIETTIPSYYFETRRAPVLLAWRGATRFWWDRYRHLYQLYTSRFVIAELQRAPARKSAQMLRLMSEAEVLADPADVAEVAAFYIQHHAMPAEAEGDAYHLAVACLLRFDFLLTWNCKHLANANKIEHLRVLNARLGLMTPIITTPLNLLPETAT